MTVSMQLYKSQFDPLNDTSIVGGSQSATLITGATVGEVFRAITANIAGSSAQVRYQKVFLYNNGTTPLSAAATYITNALAATPGVGTCTVVSTNSADSSQLQAQIIGIDVFNNPNQEILVLNGTAPVQGVINWSQVWKVIIQGTGTSTPTPVTGTISVSVGGVVLGGVPPNFYSATAEIAIGLPTTLNDSATSTNDLTPPIGITFTAPNAYSTGIPLANSGVLPANNGQGVWVQQTIPAGLATSPDVQIVHGIGGTG
jgi:hypothetical protein